MRQEELVCVNCPKGCNVTVQLEGDEVKDVQGYGCKEGLNYARQEVIRPMRILTSTVRIEGAYQSTGTDCSKPNYCIGFFGNGCKSRVK